MVRLALVLIALALLSSPAPAGAAQRAATSKRTISTACSTQNKQPRKRCPRWRTVLKRVAGRARMRPATSDSVAGGTDAAGVETAVAGGPGSAEKAPGEIASAPAAAPMAPPVASTVGADAYDFGTFVLRLTRVSVPAGNLTIYFHNHDSSDHNLWLDPPQLGAPAVQISDAVGENGGAWKTVAVTAGTWRLYCSIAGHSSMTRDLAVG